MTTRYLGTRIAEERDALIEAIVTERETMAEAIAADYGTEPEETYEDLAGLEVTEPAEEVE